MEDSTPHDLLSVLRSVAADKGVQAWLVGGTVRDLEIGRPSPDLDAVVDGGAEEVAREAADRLRCPWFVLSEEHDTHRVVGDEGYLDVALLRGPDIDADLRLRDFTVNAMARPLEGGPVIDPFGGLSDLRSRRLVAVSASVFRDDPVRLLRAPRLMRELRFEAAPSLERLIRRDAGRVGSAPGERMGDEVIRTFAAGGSARSVALWDRLGLLDEVFPEAAALRGLEQSRFHHLDALGHTLEVLGRLDGLLDEGADWFGEEVSARLEARMSTAIDGRTSRPAGVRLAALLHDIGKPGTRSLDGDGVIRFWGHTEAGVRAAGAVCARLASSRALTSLVERVAERHLSIGFLQHQDPLPRREIVRYLWEVAPWEPEVILVSAADRLATRGELTDERFVRGHLDLSRMLMHEWVRRDRYGVPGAPVRGDELAERLGIEPGPLLGRVLEEVQLAWEAGEVAGEDEVFALARRAAQREQEGGPPE